jgi:hypothetical protein
MKKRCYSRTIRLQGEVKGRGAAGKRPMGRMERQSFGHRAARHHVRFTDAISAWLMTGRFAPLRPTGAHRRHLLAQWLIPAVTSYTYDTLAQSHWMSQPRRKRRKKADRFARGSTGEPPGGTCSRRPLRRSVSVVKKVRREKHVSCQIVNEIMPQN